MAQVHDLNGTTVNYIEAANWLEGTVGQSLNVIALRPRWRVHRWQSRAIPMSEWEAIIALRGSRVTLTTTDPDDRNGDYVTYYDAILQTVNGSHVSRNMATVSIDFLVRT